MPEVSYDELAELQWKYEEMLRLRLADEASPGGDPRREMAALAERFPGALRELDERTLETIRARIGELAGCVAEKEEAAPWMIASVRFHRLMRGALAAKKWLGARRTIDAVEVRAFREELEGLSCPEDARAWADDLDAIARPPQGKLTALVFERLARELEVSAVEARLRLYGP